MIGQQLVRSWAAPAMRGVQRRGVSVISGPARTPVPFSVQVAAGIGMTAAWLFTPAWVLYHLKEYKGKE